MTSDNLSASITQALTDSTMRVKAAQVGESIRDEPDGVAQAIKLIEQSVQGDFYE